MSRFRPWRLTCVLVALPLFGCRQSEPPPRYAENLGTEDEPLLPTAGTWKDARLVSGQSEWHPFREPVLNAAKEAAEAVADAPPAADPKVVEEIRAVLKEHNEKLASAAYAELAEFYAVQQAEAVPKIAEALSSLSTKLKELGGSLPDEKSKLERLAQLLAPNAMLKLDVASIDSSGDNAAVARLADLPQMAFLPDIDPAQISRDVRFDLGEDGYWYIQSPVIGALNPVLASLQASAGQLDAALADASGGGGASAALLDEKASDVRKMLDRLGEAGAEPDSVPAPADAQPEKS